MTEIFFLEILYKMQFRIALLEKKFNNLNIKDVILLFNGQDR